MMSAMKKQYGAKKGESTFYATQNKMKGKGRKSFKKKHSGQSENKPRYYM